MSDHDADAMIDDDVTPEADSGMMIDELARLPSKTILDEARMASLLGVTERSIRRTVERGELPPGISLGKRTVWLSDRVLNYVDARAAEVEQEGRQRGRKIRQLSS